MNSVLLVMAGGAVGAAARFGVYLGLARVGMQGFWATLAVNLLGGFLLGVLSGVLVSSNLGGPANRDGLRLFLAVGVLGGFTTFSAFSLDVVRMVERRDLSEAMVYVLVSVVGSIVMLAFGLVLGRRLV